MCLSRTISTVLTVGLLSVALSGVASANGIVVGIGAEADTVDGHSYSLFVDVGVTENTWVSGAVARNQTENNDFDLDAKFADISIDHFFEPIGIRLGASYWGDEGFLESKDAHGSFYLRGDKGSISADFEHRDFDLTINFDLLPNPLLLEFSATGYGLSGRWAISDRATINLGGLTYDYSRNISAEPGSDRLRFLSQSRFSLVNSLIDYRVNAGVEIKFGLRRLEFRYSSWETAVVQGRVNSLGVGFLTPVSDAVDLEFRLAFDDSDDFGRATVFSIFMYLFDE